MWKFELNGETKECATKAELQEEIAQARVAATGKPYTKNIDLYNVCKFNRTATLLKYGITNLREE